jgi:hypothetical protein
VAALQVQADKHVVVEQEVVCSLIVVSRPDVPQPPLDLHNLLVLVVLILA